ncbi:unnamed protein product [Hanseniaspora opuntiae]
MGANLAGCSRFTKIIITWLLILGNLLLLFLLIFTGTTDHFPIDKIYLLQANTSNITSATHDVTRWTFWGICGVNNGDNVCSKNNNYNLSPAYPLSPVDNFDTTTNIPSDFKDNRNTYYYLSRFNFAFVLLGLIFQFVAGVIYFFSWTHAFVTKLAWFFQIFATLFSCGAAGVVTPLVVLAKRAFNKTPQVAGSGKAKINVDYLAIMWASAACSILLFFIMGGNFIMSSLEAHKKRVEFEKLQNDAQKYNEFINNGSAPVFDNQQDLEYTAPALEGGYLNDQTEAKEFVDSDEDIKTEVADKNQVSRNNTVISSRKSLDNSIKNSGSKYGIKFFSVRDQKSRNDLKEEDESEY